jgi:hypothetical protein
VWYLHNCRVCYLAGEFAHHLEVLQKDFEQQCQQQQDTKQQNTEVQQQKDISDKAVPDIISEKEERCLRLAGLCHDLGK